jgi:hypothetical protein
VMSYIFQTDIRYVRCQRCQLSLRIAVQPGNPDALLMRRSITGEGLCASCAATLFLQSVENIKRSIDRNRELLLWDVMQIQFAMLMREGQADAKPEEIDWHHVYEHWDLPFPEKRGKA